MIIASPNPDSRPGFRPALDILATAVAAADPGAAVRRHFKIEGESLRSGDWAMPFGEIDRIFLVGAGKAATGMLAAAEDILGDRVTTGVGVTVAGAEAPLRHCTLHTGGHPLPDPAGMLATRQIGRMLAEAGERDLVIALISGGASALLEQPAGRIPLIDLQATTSMLLGSGASIQEVNTVRKHLSRVKGGGLARMAAPARLLTLILSDVVGSPLDVVASGPTVPDPSRYAEAAAVLAERGLWARLPASIGDHLRAGMSSQIPETPKPGDPIFERAETRLVGDNAVAVAAAAERAEELGYHSQVATTFLEGEAREAGAFLAGLGKEALRQGDALDGSAEASLPACILAGGETTVTLRRLGGQGGRNQELALAAAIALDDPAWEGVTLAAMGSDGIDGATQAAGAIVDGRTAERARALELDPAAALERHDSGPFFAQLGDRIVTGPTGTNVNDLVVVLVGSPASG